MNKFIVECKDGGYVISYLDYLTSISTDKCSTIDEAIYNMSIIFEKNIRTPSPEMTESMSGLKNLAEVGKLPVELIGINLMNGDELRNKISNKFKIIASEYLSYIGKV